MATTADGGQGDVVTVSWRVGVQRSIPRGGLRLYANISHVDGALRVPQNHAKPWDR